MPALAAVDRALAQTSELSGAVRGLLRIGFVLTTEGPPLRRLITAFQARYPGCEVRLQEVETFDAYRALRRGDVDVLCEGMRDQPHPASPTVNEILSLVARGSSSARPERSSRVLRAVPSSGALR